MEAFRMLQALVPHDLPTPPLSSSLEFPIYHSFPDAAFVSVLYFPSPGFLTHPLFHLETSYASPTALSRCHSSVRLFSSLVLWQCQQPPLASHVSLTLAARVVSEVLAPSSSTEAPTCPGFTKSATSHSRFPSSLICVTETPLSLVITEIWGSRSCSW